MWTIKEVQYEQSGFQDMINEDTVGGWNGVEFLSSSVSQGGANLKDEIRDLHCFEQNP